MFVSAELAGGLGLPLVRASAGAPSNRWVGFFYGDGGGIQNLY